MSEKELKSKIKNVEINDAAQLWKFLESEGGINTSFYDKELFRSDDPDLNLYTLLGIAGDSPSVAENLSEGQVSLEHFLEVLLTAFHPYSLMMSEICLFFAKYEIKYAKENITMEFDFDAVGEELKFNLQNFREVLRKHHFVEIQRSVYDISLEQISRLNSIFNLPGHITIENESAKAWLNSYFDPELGAVFNEPNVEVPITGHSDLDKSLEILMSIWGSFVNCCRIHGRTLDDLIIAASNLDDDTPTDWNSDILGDVNLLCKTALDHWPKFFIERLFKSIQEIDRFYPEARNERFNELSEELKEFISQLTMNTVIVHQTVVVDQLLDILSLPVWKFRYELYAAWILTKIDMAFDGYEVMLNHDKGSLPLGFKERHISTIQTAEGEIELWCEVRSALDNPSSSKRKAAIQPDYRIFFNGEIEFPEKHLAAVEVKQYRYPSRKNFSEALNDYAMGLPQAAIFLVNYGPVRDNLPLVFPDRCSYMGQIRPDGDDPDKFVRALSAVLPVATPMEERPEHYLDESQLVLFFGCPIEQVYVDISESLDSPEYKLFLRTILKDLLNRKAIVKLSAVDSIERYQWKNPDLTSLEELTELDFTGGTYFGDIINGLRQKLLIITDTDGYRDCVRNSILIGGCLIYDEGTVQFKAINADLWL